MATPQAISLIPIDRFLDRPPPGISVSSNPASPRSFTVKVDRSKAFFVTSTSYTTQGIKKRLKFVNHCGHIFRVRTEDGWTNVTRSILARPLYFMCKCKVQTDEDYDPLLHKTTRYFTTADYVVRLETQTEPVRRVLRELFDIALQRIRNGERYSMKIELRDSIANWFEQNRAQTYECGGTRQFDNSYFALTNSSLPHYHHCTCDDDPVGCFSAAVFCLPCLLLIGLPYYISRRCRFKDSKHQFMGEVKVTAGGPPLQSGAPSTPRPGPSARPATSQSETPAKKTSTPAPAKTSKSKAAQSKTKPKKEARQPLLEKEPIEDDA